MTGLELARNIYTQITQMTQAHCRRRFEESYVDEIPTNIQPDTTTNDSKKPNLGVIDRITAKNASTHCEQGPQTRCRQFLWQRLHMHIITTSKTVSDNTSYNAMPIKKPKLPN